MGTIVDIGFQSLAYASVLYLVSVGLSVTLGLMGFVNLAHGVFAMIGGYIAAVAIKSLGAPWLLMLVVSPLLTAVVAVAAERVLYSRLYGRNELDQVLFSIGLIFVAGAVIRLLFGPLPQPLKLPDGLLHQVQVESFGFYLYKLVVIGIGIVVAVAAYVGLERSRFGAMVRAAVENRGMAESIGLRTSRLFTVTFALGGALAALGGMLGADVFSLSPSYSFDVLVYMQVVVAIAGLGTLRGSFIASLLIGVVKTLSAFYLPALGTIILFLAVFLLLLARPRGIFGRI